MSRRVARRSPRTRLVGALDVGSSKIACFIAEVAQTAGGSATAGRSIRVLGMGLQRSQGVKSGVVIDPAAAETAIRSAVAQAERACGITLNEVFATISCGRLQSLSFAAHADIGPLGVAQSDIDRVFQGAQAYAERDGRALVHMNRRAFRLDGAAGGEDPRGMAARRLTADMHAVTADDSAISNLVHVIERCHLDVAGLVAAPYASALAVTTGEERGLGVSVIDMGGGMTTTAVFGGGQFLHCDAFPAGGHHLTFDIAQNLHSPLAEAERIKALWGSVVNAQSDICDRFSYAVAGESEGVVDQATRAQLAAVIRPRVESQLLAAGERLASAGHGSGPVVLTGGASALVGIAECAALCLRREVRLGRPLASLGLPAAAGTAAFAAAAGLALAAQDVGWRADETGRSRGYLGQVGQWFQNNF